MGTDTSSIIVTSGRSGIPHSATIGGVNHSCDRVETSGNEAVEVRPWSHNNSAKWLLSVDASDVCSLAWWIRGEVGVASDRAEPTVWKCGTSMSNFETNQQVHGLCKKSQINPILIRPSPAKFANLFYLVSQHTISYRRRINHGPCCRDPGDQYSGTSLAR